MAGLPMVLSLGFWGSIWGVTGMFLSTPLTLLVMAVLGQFEGQSDRRTGIERRTDDAGENFDGRCTFAISGMTPAARYWTLTLYDPDGHLVANTIDRHGFTSEEIVRNTDGAFTITVAPLARPGNWLPTGGIERFVLVWRLYDTPIGVASTTTKEGPMPAIARKGCS